MKRKREGYSRGSDGERHRLVGRNAKVWQRKIKVQGRMTDKRKREKVRAREDQMSEVVTWPNGGQAAGINTKQEFQRGSTHREQLPRGARGRTARREGMRGSEWGWTRKRARLGTRENRRGWIHARRETKEPERGRKSGEEQGAASVTERAYVTPSNDPGANVARAPGGGKRYGRRRTAKMTDGRK